MRIVLLLLGLLLATAVRAQAPESGRRSVQVWTPAQFNGAQESWAFAQDARGVLYLGNNAGVRVYDGATWREMPGLRPAIRAVTVLATGDVLVGGYKTFGRIEADTPGGALRFRSLIPPAGPSFTDGWALAATPDGAAFVADSAVFLWRRGDSLATGVRVGAQLRGAVWWRGALVTHDAARGLVRIESSSAGVRIVDVPGGTRFAGDHVFLLAPLPDGRLIVGGRAQGLWRVGGAAPERWTTGADALFTTHRATQGILRSGTRGIAVATESAGVLLVGADGRVERIDGSDGLPDDDARGVFEDARGGVWVALARGVARIAGDGATRFAEADGIPGTVTALARHRGRLYAATLDGLFALDRSGERARFAPVLAPAPGRVDCQALLATPQALLAACEHGVHVLGGAGGPQWLPTPTTTYAFHRLRADTTLVYVGLREGLMRLRLVGGRWRPDVLVAGRAQVRTFAEGADGVLWAGTDLEGLWRVARPAAPMPRMAQLPVRTAERVQAYELGGVPLFSSRDGLFRADLPRGIRPDTVLAPHLPDGVRDVFRFAEGPDGRLWLRASGRSAVAWRAPHGYRWDEAPLAVLPPDPPFAFLPERGAMWAGGPFGLARIAATPEPQRDAVAALVRRVSTLAPDSILFDGLGPRGAVGGDPAARLPYRSGALRFAYAAPTFDSATQYRVRLDGLDADWTEWTDETQKDYTALQPGRYVFRVEARDREGRIGPQGRFALVVAPPWYRSGWALALWGLLAAIAIGGAVEVRTRRLRTRTRHLEALVAERTGEIAAQKRQIEDQHARLVDLDAAKSRFVTNLTHELRTPLTLVIGPLEHGLDGGYGTLPAAVRARDEAALRNGRRLLRLINQLLDLARIEAGTLRLDPVPTDLAATAREIARAFAPLADRHRLHLRVDAPAAVMVAVDRDGYEKMLSNLLSNAVKFTPEGGTVTVRVAHDDGWAVTAVADTGPGLTAEAAGRVFERFFQADETDTRGHEGAGVGLALVRELAGLHGGHASVETAPGAGAIFRIALPTATPHAGGDGARQPPASGEGSAVENEPGADLQPDRSTVPSPSGPAGAGAPSRISPTGPSDARRTVLVVDDSADVRAFVRAVLSGRYDIVEAADGLDGLDAARAHLPDVVVADVMMPRLDGLSLTRALREGDATGGIPVLLLTARAATADEVDGLRAGADDYVAKPFAPDALLARVDTLIASRERLRARLAASPDATAPAPVSAFVAAVHAAIDARLDDPAFTVEELAGAVALSYSQLGRRLREEGGMTPGDLLRTRRLDRAAALLREGAGNVSEVAYAVGFVSLAHFSRAFRAHFGHPPSALRRAHG